jgi:uncharacterized protein (DUF1697 family)
MTPTRSTRSITRFIGLLRAINVGGHIVKMQALQAHFETLGFSDVRTVIASGNVLFDADGGDAASLEARIERHLEAALGYPVATFLRTPAELAAVAAHEPFSEGEARSAGYALQVAFTRAAVSAESERLLLASRSEIDDFHVRGREIYWARRTSLGQSKFTGARLEKILGMPATARNITTVRRLAALTEG